MNNSSTICIILVLFINLRLISVIKKRRMTAEKWLMMMMMMTMTKTSTSSDEMVITPFSQLFNYRYSNSHKYIITSQFRYMHHHHCSYTNLRNINKCSDNQIAVVTRDATHLLLITSTYGVSITHALFTLIKLSFEYNILVLR